MNKKEHKKKKELKYVMDYLQVKKKKQIPMEMICLLYTSDAADE